MNYTTNKEMIALLLAGGQGSRLGVLTNTVAKPAVMYGGKYRIIDFSLSNCINSGIDTVGVLTQYQPLELNNHIGIGKPWDLDRMNGGVTILAPYTSQESGEWFLGTADAVYQNIHYIDSINPKYILVLSGDHIYKMNFSIMLESHIKNNAGATISVIEVPYEEASRFGIMNADDAGKIYEFEEKPENPKSNLASMGIYIFNWELIREYLIDDHNDSNSEHDFGKNIIPKMLYDNQEMWTFKFSGYWRDVGTLQSFWESNIDLIKRVPNFNLFDPFWKIYTPNPVEPAHYISPTGNVKKSIVAEGCLIYGNVKNSVIFPGVHIEEDAVVEDSIIMSGSLIKRNAHIYKTIVGENSTVGKNAKTGLGNYAESVYNKKVYNCDITVIGSNSNIPKDAMIGKNVVIDSHLEPEDFKDKNLSSGQAVIKGGL